MSASARGGQVLHVETGSALQRRLRATTCPRSAAFCQQYNPAATNLFEHLARLRDFLKQKPELALQWVDLSHSRCPANTGCART